LLKSWLVEAQLARGEVLSEVDLASRCRTSRTAGVASGTAAALPAESLWHPPTENAAAMTAASAAIAMGLK